MNKDELLQQLCSEIQLKFGADSSKMFGVLLMLQFMDTKDWVIPDYIRSVPELSPYVDYIENSELLKQIFKQN